MIEPELNSMYTIKDKRGFVIPSSPSLVSVSIFISGTWSISVNTDRILLYQYLSKEFSMLALRENIHIQVKSSKNIY
jgi:hypothetical protein